MAVNQFNDGGMFICVDFKKIPLEIGSEITDKEIVNLLDRALSSKKYVLAKNFIKKGTKNKELNYIFKYAEGVFSGNVYSGGMSVCELRKDASRYMVEFI